MRTTNHVEVPTTGPDRTERAVIRAEWAKRRAASAPTAAGGRGPALLAGAVAGAGPVRLRPLLGAGRGVGALVVLTTGETACGRGPERENARRAPSFAPGAPVRRPGRRGSGLSGTGGPYLPSGPAAIGGETTRAGRINHRWPWPGR